MDILMPDQTRNPGKCESVGERLVLASGMKVNRPIIRAAS